MARGEWHLAAKCKWGPLAPERRGDEYLTRAKLGSLPWPSRGADPAREDGGGDDGAPSGGPDIPRDPGQPIRSRELEE